MNDCDCIIPSFDLFNVFSTILLKNSDMLFTATIKSHENFVRMFEITEEQQKFIIDYLREGNGNFKHSMSQRVDFTSDKSVIVQRILEKLYKPKIVFGKFQSKENNTIAVKQFKISKGEMFPNGRIKDYNEQITNSWDLKIKYIEEKSEDSLKSQYKDVMKKLCFNSESQVVN